MSIKTILLLILTSLLYSVDSLLAQEFRSPDISESTRRNKPSSNQDFIPEGGKNGFGLVPVKPKNANETGTPQLSPGSNPGRSVAQERILDRIRSGNFDATEKLTSESSKPQIIRQRYEDGKIQLVRQVIQKEDGNFYNDGPWRLYNRSGQLMASGQFLDGAMDGSWERWHAANAGGIFATKPFSEFKGPFISTATFNSGKLDGVWVISDQYRRKIIEIPYRNGRREGAATWWYPSSERMRVANFKGGELDGTLREWDEENQLTLNHCFV